MKSMTLIQYSKVYSSGAYFRLEQAPPWNVSCGSLPLLKGKNPNGQKGSLVTGDWKKPIYSQCPLIFDLPSDFIYFPTFS